jgi:hypothetical protein
MGEGDPEVLLSRCSGKSLRDLSRIASGEKTLKINLQCSVFLLMLTKKRYFTKHSHDMVYKK